MEVIQVRQTGFRWDVRGSNPTVGTDVIGFPPQTPGLNQRWTITRVATQGASGIYNFRPVVPNGRAAYANGIQGDAIASQAYASPFNVTQRAANDPGFFISVPGSPLTVTSASSVGSPANALTLQPLAPTNNLKVWTFERVV